MDDKSQNKRPIVGDDGELISPDSSVEYLELVTLYETEDLRLSPEPPQSPRRSRMRWLIGIGFSVVFLFFAAVILTPSPSFIDGDTRAEMEATAAVSHPLPGSVSDEVRTSAPTSTSIRDCEWSPDGQYLAVSNYRGKTRIWDVANGTQSFALEDNPMELRWSPDGTLLISRAWTQTTVWDTETGTSWFRLFSDDGIPATPTWSLDGSKIAGVIEGHTLVLYHPQTGQALRTIRIDELPEQESVIGLAWTQGGLFALTNYSIIRWDTDTWEYEIVQRLENLSFRNERWLAMTVSDDGRYLLAAKTNGEYQSWTIEAFIWDTTANTIAAEADKVFTLFENDPSSDSPVDQIMVSADGSQFVTIDNSIFSIWDATTGERLDTIPFNDSLIVDADWSPDGQHLAVCGYSFVRVYSLDG